MFNPMKSQYTLGGNQVDSPYKLPLEDTAKLLQTFIGTGGAGDQMMVQSTFNDMYKMDDVYKNGHIAMYQSGG